MRDGGRMVKASKGSIISTDDNTTIKAICAVVREVPFRFFIFMIRHDDKKDDESASVCAWSFSSMSEYDEEGRIKYVSLVPSSLDATRLSCGTLQEA